GGVVEDPVVQALVIAALQHGLHHGGLAGSRGRRDEGQRALADEYFVGVQDLEGTVDRFPGSQVLTAPLIQGKDGSPFSPALRRWRPFQTSSPWCRSGCRSSSFPLRSWPAHAVPRKCSRG